MTTRAHGPSEWELAFQKIWTIVLTQPKPPRGCHQALKTVLVDGNHAAAFPMSRYSDIRALVARANNEKRISVSLVLPVSVRMPKPLTQPDKGGRQRSECFLLIADILPKRAFEYVTTLKLSRSARVILKENGLSLHGLARRETRSNKI